MSLDPARCPLCGNTNACAIVEGASTCWCFEMTISGDVLERVPPEARGVVCICKACASSEAKPTHTSEPPPSPSRTR